MDLHHSEQWGRVCGSYNYTQRGNFHHKFVRETPSSPFIHTFTLLPPSRLLQWLGRRDGFENLLPVLPVLPHQRMAQGFYGHLLDRGYPHATIKPLLICHKQSRGEKNTYPSAKNTSCNAKPHPKRLTTNYFFILITLLEIQLPKLSRNFGESWCYFHKTNLILPSSEIT